MYGLSTTPWLRLATSATAPRLVLTRQLRVPASLDRIPKVALARQEKEEKDRLKEQLKLEKRASRQQAAEEKAEQKKAAKVQAQTRKAEVAKAKQAKLDKRTTSLRPPKAPGNAWTTFFSDYIAEHKGSLEKGKDVLSLTPAAAEEYRYITPHQKSLLLARLEEAKAAYPATLTAWKATLTPEMIKGENLHKARKRKGVLAMKRALKAEGEPKRPSGSFVMFSSDYRAGTGVPKDLEFKEQSRVIAAAWRELSPEQRDVYTDRATALMVQFREALTVFAAAQLAKKTPVFAKEVEE